MKNNLNAVIVASTQDQVREMSVPLLLAFHRENCPCSYECVVRPEGLDALSRDRELLCPAEKVKGVHMFILHQTIEVPHEILGRLFDAGVAVIRLTDTSDWHPLGESIPARRVLSVNKYRFDLAPCAWAVRGYLGLPQPQYPKGTEFRLF